MTKNNDSAVNSDDVADMITRGLKDGQRNVANHKYEGEGTKKLFGLIELDSMIATLAEGLWLTFSGEFTKKLSPKTYSTAHSVLGKVIKDAPMLNRLAAGTALAVNVGINVAPMAGDMIGKLNKQNNDKVALVRRLAPVLDDIVGSHSVGAFERAGAKNEMLLVQRRRLRKEHDTKNFYDLLYTGVVAGPNLLREGVNFKGVVSGEDRSKIRADIRLAEEAAKSKQAGAPDEEHGKLFDFEKLSGSFAAANFSVSQVIEQVRKKKIDHLMKTRQPYTALEMVLELDDQAQYKTTGSFKLPGTRGGSLQLEQYVAQVIEQHQRDMSDISDDHTHIREALREEVQAVAKVISESIRKGDMGAIELIRLVGEGHIIKNRGRAIADPDDVKTVIEQRSGKALSALKSDPKEYMANVTFSEKDAIEGLKKMDKEERLSFGTILPDWMLEKAGLGDEEVRAIQTHRASHMAEIVEQSIAAMPTDLKQLKEENLTSSDIRQLEKAQELMQREGKDAIKKLKSSSSNAHGIEQVVANWALPQIVGGKTSFGTLLEKGREALAAPKEVAANDHDGVHAERGDAAHARKFTDKISSRASRPHANDEHANEDFAKRESHRRVADNHGADREF